MIDASDIHCTAMTSEVLDHVNLYIRAGLRILPLHHPVRFGDGLVCSCGNPILRPPIDRRPFYDWQCPWTIEIGRRCHRSGPAHSLMMTAAPAWRLPGLGRPLVLFLLDG
jgi:hypothetical protein